MTCDARRLAGISALLLVLGSTPTSAALGDGGSGSDGYEAAVTLVADGKLEEASGRLKGVLADNPRHLSSRILLGRIYLDVGYAAAAEEQFRTAIRAGADLGLVAVQLGRALRDQRRYRELIETLEPSSFVEKVRGEVLVLHGEAHLALGDLKAAEEAFSAAEGLIPQSASPLTGRAHLAMLRGDLEAARQAAQRATRIEPEHAGAWFVRGEVERTLGHADDAIGHLGEAIARVEGHLPARNARAALNIDKGEFEAARKDVEYVRLRMPRDPQSAYLHSRILFHDGHRAAARDALSAAAAALAELNPQTLREHAPSALLAGVVAQAQERYEDAYQYFSSYVARFPFNAGANTRLASLALRRGETDRARTLIEPVLTAEPNNGRARVVMGDVEMRSGRAAEAREHLRAALGAFPGNPVVAMQLARAQMGDGDVAAGQATLQRVVEAHPRNAVAAMSLGMLYLRQSEPARAEQMARQILELDPESPSAFNLLASAQAGLGNMDAAERTFQRGLAVAPTNRSLRLNRARVAIADGRFEVARDQYLAMLEADRGSVDAMLGLADLASVERNEAEVERWLASAAASGSSAAVTAAIRLVDHYVARRDLDAAASKLDELEGRHFGDLRVLAARGRLELASDRRQQAVDIFDRLARAAGDNVRGLVVAARLQRRARDFDGARWSLSRAAELAPRDADVLAALVRLEIIAGDMARAAARVEQVRALTGNRAAGLADRLAGDVAMANDRFDDALASYRAAAKRLGLASDLVLLIYRARRLGGDPEGAIGELSAWLEERPEDTLVRRQRGTALMALGRNKAAASDFERVLARSPRDVLVLNNLAHVLEDDDPDRALLMARRARDLLPTDGAVADTLGWLLVRAGEHERGLELLREARRMAGDVPEVRYHLAVALHGLGRYAAARKELGDLLATDATFKGRADAASLLEKLQQQ